MDYNNITIIIGVVLGLHAILYFIFFVCAIMKKTSSWLILLLDALIGLGAFIVHYL